MGMRLPPKPVTGLRVVEDFTARSQCDEGFLRLRRISLVACFADGTTSNPFPYDEVRRTQLDAVVIVPHFRDEKGEVHVFLRSALRPPVALREPEVCPIPEAPTQGHLWEVPAGLVELSERSEQGLRNCAARELFEELGLAVSPEEMEPLGPSTFPAPALIGERHFFFHCQVDPTTRCRPKGDGSPLERKAKIVSLPLDTAIDLVRIGEVEDAKTEIALRRFQETVP